MRVQRNSYTVIIRGKSLRAEMKLAKIVLVSLIALVSLYFLLNQLISLEKRRSRIISPLTDSAVITPTVKPSSDEVKQSNSQGLKDAVGEALKGTTGIYGVYVKHLKTGESYVADEHRAYDSASLYKLWVMAVVYRQIQNGQLTQDQVLSQDVSVLNEKFDIDPETAELTEGTITLSIRDALEKMITISDNYAALLLTEKVRLSSSATFLKENNFAESTVGTSGGSPMTTPFDIARFLEKLYNGDFADSKYTQEMIDLLKNQKLRGGIPKYIPDKTKVANKTGEIGEFKHDAGIIYTDSGDYVIVVMSESNDPLGAQERIALVSKAVFEYFVNKRSGGED